MALLLAVTMATVSHCITITAWNVRTLNGARPYINKLMENADVLIISEHRLYESQLYQLDTINSEFIASGKSSRSIDNRTSDTKLGQGGIATFWRKTIAHRVITVDVNSDRINALQILGDINQHPLFIIGVYLPQVACKISSYETEVETLSKLILSCREQGEVIVIGDWNCQLGSQIGNRFTGSTSPNGNILLASLFTNNMCVIDGLDICSGPKYTYYVEGIGQSYIDHVAVSNDLLPYISRCDIIKDCIINTSDHLPVSVTINRSFTIPNSGRNEGRIPWHKIPNKTISQEYTNKLEEFIEIKFPSSQNSVNLSDIERDIHLLNDCMKSAADSLRKTKRPGNLKPYWNNSLTVHSKSKKQLWKEWQISGRIKESTLHKQYKEAKRLFRRQHRQAERDYQQKKITDIAKAHDIDQNHFWYLVNKFKKRNQSTHPIKLENGEVICDPQRLCQEWANYFENLYTPKQNEEYDEQFRITIENELDEILQHSYSQISDLPLFTTEDLINICKDLKCKKAAGHDGLVAEHYKYAGEKCISVITNLFNNICKLEAIPHHFKQGLLIPIPKGDKDKSKQDNHRGITLLQTIRKMFEKGLIKKRIKGWVKNGSLIDDLQGAEQDKCSSLETNWVVREVASHYCEQDTSLYICMLDVKKAFDSVWQKAIFYKLYKAGMDPKIWRLIVQLYSEPECCVKVSGVVSSWITAKVGIIQGAPLSMLNYEFLSNDLLTMLKECNAGTVLNDIVTTCPAFADDLTLTASTRRGLQTLLDVAYEHSKKWRYCFNPKKCAVVVFGEKNIEEAPFKMGESKIHVVPANEHVGTLLTQSKWEMISHIKGRVESCNKPGYAITSIGSKAAPMTPVSASKLYWSVCVPKLTYGLHLSPLPSEAIDTLESYHAKMAKTFQGLPDQTSNIGAVAGLGWLSIQGYIDMTLLNYFMRIISLPVDCVYKRLFIVRYCNFMYNDCCHHGPVSMFLKVCKKYEILSNVKQAVEECKIPNKLSWKCIVKQKVWWFENRQWNIHSRLHKSLNNVSAFLPTIRTLGWWEYAQTNPQDTSKCRTTVKLI